MSRVGRREDPNAGVSSTGVFISTNQKPKSKNQKPKTGGYSDGQTRSHGQEHNGPAKQKGKDRT